jgi:hypothetical protein
MRLEDISIPEVYKEESWDFRFFLKWLITCLTKHKYDTEHIYDLYDPLKCKKELLWMLGDTVGWKYDDRLPAAFNRLVLLYFAKMMRYKGSRSGVTFAAELNLAEFNLINYEVGYEDANGKVVKGKTILEDRLEDTTVPSNSVYVTPHTALGYIDVVYFSTKKPIDACIEYVRPLGMYLFQHAGVHFDARTQISVDARLTNTREMYESIGPTHVGHYTRDDYARMQRVYDLSDSKKYDGEAVQSTVTDAQEVGAKLQVATNDNRQKVWYRNSEHEKATSKTINPGYRAIYSLQLCNNEQIVKGLIGTVIAPKDPIFSLGYGPQDNNDEYNTEPYYVMNSPSNTKNDNINEKQWGAYVTEDNVRVVNPKSYLKDPYRDEHYPYINE